MNNITNEFFPEIQLSDLIVGGNDTYGILNISLCKSKNVLTGYVWKYTYNNNGKLKVLSSYDLVKLRKMVENENQEWIIFDLQKAQETYDFNRKLQKKHKQLKKNTYNSNKVSASGVKYVYKNKDGRRKNSHQYWCYRGKNKSYHKKKLSDLHKKIQELNLPWIITDETVYNNIIEKEKN